MQLRRSRAFAALHSRSALLTKLAHRRRDVPDLQLGSSRMLTRLEHETRDHHEAAAADRFSIVGDPTPESYYRFLASVYQFEYAIESQVVYVAELSLRFVAASLRTGLLGQDLLALRQRGHV